MIPWGKPIWVLFCAACSAPSEMSSTVPPAPAALDLHGEWRRDYVTAGAIAQHTRLQFRKDGSLGLDSSSMTSLTEPPAEQHDEGTYQLTGDGTVRYEWGDDGRVEALNSLTIVSMARLREHPCCSRVNEERYWTHRGYLARDGRSAEFYRESSRRAVDPVGAVTSWQRTSVTLVFSAPPSTLSPGDACSFQARFVLEVADATRDYELTLPCRLESVDPNAGVVLVPGWDVSEGASLADYPHRAGTVWQSMLAERTDLEDWPEALRTALALEFEPYLAFDRRQPNVLVHYMETNAPAIEGYAWVGPLD